MSDNVESESLHLVEGESLGCAVTIDGDGDVVVVLWVMKEGVPYTVALEAQGARALAGSLLGMADEVDELTMNISNMTDAEIALELDRITKGLAGQED